MSRRRKISDGKSQKLFTRTAMNVHKKNVQSRPMRGGIRL